MMEFKTILAALSMATDEWRSGRSSSSTSVLRFVTIASDRGGIMTIPLKFRDNGPDVIVLQKLLNRNGESVTVDGIFGNETLTAVRDFQSKHSDLDGNPLVSDGVAGALTVAALENAAGEAAGGTAASFAGF